MAGCAPSAFRCAVSRPAVTAKTAFSMALIGCAA
jgi:hypothetical protein